VSLFHGATNAIGAYFPLTALSIGQGPNLPTLVMEIIVAGIIVPYLLQLKYCD